MDFFIVLVTFAILLLPACVKIINQNERGVVMTLGKFTGIREPGINFVLPGIQRLVRVDIRTKTTDVPNQEVITKDNIPVQINAVVYYRIKDAAKAILEVENYMYAVSQLAQTTMRNAVGERSLDDLLSKRDEIAEGIKVTTTTNPEDMLQQLTLMDIRDEVMG